MKELKLLPEDWKPEINKHKASFATKITTVYWPAHSKYSGLGDDATYYEVIAGKAVELTPEPRPADSIKLSECDKRHIITCKRGGRFVSIKHESDVWVSRFIDGDYMQWEPTPYLFSLCGTYEDIKIFDMSK